MKLIFIIVSLNTGGAQSILIRMLKNINKEKFKVYVISLTDKGELGDTITNLGFPLLTLNMKKNCSIFSSLFKLIKLMKKIKPDIVHTWMYHSDLIGGLAAKILGVKLIIWGVRSADFFSPATPISTKFIVKVCAFLSNFLPDKIVYNSYKGQEFHHSIGYQPKKSYLIYNGVDTNKFKSNTSSSKLLKNRLKIDVNKKVIGLIARYDYLKNHEGFIEMASYIIKEDKSFHFLMIGDYVKDNSIMLQALKKKKLEKKFHLLDNVNEVENIISGLDAVVITSTSEAFPNVLIESMSCGVPCFSTDVGDVKKIIHDHEWVVPVNDMKQLANVCIRYFDYKEKHKKLVKQEMINRTHKVFSSELATNYYELLYESKN